MGVKKTVKMDFENPSVLFVLEDILKGLIGGPFLFNPYFKTFGLKGDEKVLDFGCGGGVGAKCLAKLLNHGGHVTCIDVSRYWIKKARKRLGKCPNTECWSGDIRRLDIPDHSFDVISIMHVIHDIVPQERPDIIVALCRKLKKTGTLFLREPTRESHGIPVDEIHRLFQEAGLKETGYTLKKSEYMGIYRPA